MTALLAQRMDDSHDALGIAIPALAARAASLLAPHDETAKLLLGVVIRCRDAGDESVGEERFFVREKVRANAAHTAQTEPYPTFEVAKEYRLQTGDDRLKVLACLGSIAHSIPARQMHLGEQKQRFTELPDIRARILGESHKPSDQVGPTDRSRSRVARAT